MMSYQVRRNRRVWEVRRGAVMQYVKSGEEQLPWGGAIEQAEATE